MKEKENKPHRNLKKNYIRQNHGKEGVDLVAQPKLSANKRR